jgi:hypothetical protein
VLRLEYLFPLAHVCHISPPETWELTVTEFARLLQGIDAEAQKPQG